MHGLFGSFRRSPALSVSMSPAVAAGGVLISFEGRLDDRAALIAELGLLWRVTDAEILAAAYRKWDKDFLAHVLGDYAIALWDGHAGRLLLSRDALGIYPLYYHRTPEAITWSAHLELLLDETGCDRTIDRDYIAARRCSPQSNDKPVDAAGLLRVLALELWLRRLERPPASMPQSRAKGGIRTTL